MKRLYFLVSALCVLLMSSTTAFADQISEGFESWYSATTYLSSSNKTVNYTVNGETESILWHFVKNTTSSTTFAIQKYEGNTGNYCVKSGDTNFIYVQVIKGTVNFFAKPVITSKDAYVKVYKSTSSYTQDDLLSTLTVSGRDSYASLSNAVEVENGWICLELCNVYLDDYVNDIAEEANAAYPVSGTVVDLDNNPVEGATVTVGDASCTTDAEGKYSFEAITNGTTDFVVTPSAELSAKGYATTTFTETVSEEISGLTLPLRLGVSTLTGTTMDKQTTTFKAIYVAADIDLYNNDTKELVASTKTTTSENLTTGTAYSFTIEGALASSYTLKVTATDYDPVSYTTVTLNFDGTRTWNVNDMCNRKVDPADGSNINNDATITMEKTNGKLFDYATTDQPVASFVNDATKAETQVVGTVETTSKVTWNLADSNLPAGDYTVTIAATAFHPQLVLHYTVVATTITCNVEGVEASEKVTVSLYKNGEVSETVAYNNAEISFNVENDDLETTYKLVATSTTAGKYQTNEAGKFVAGVDVSRNGIANTIYMAEADLNVGDLVQVVGDELHSIAIKFVGHNLTVNANHDDITLVMTARGGAKNATVSAINMKATTATDKNQNTYIKLVKEFTSENWDKDLELGTYTLTIPANTITIDDAVSYDQAITNTYAIVETGVESVESADSVVDVYSISGVVVERGISADALNQLPNGLYIVKGNNATYKFIKK